MNDANEENNHNNSTHNLNEISAPRWPKGVSCHGYVWERERESKSSSKSLQLNFVFVVSFRRESDVWLDD